MVYLPRAPIVVRHRHVSEPSHAGSCAPSRGLLGCDTTERREQSMHDCDRYIDTTGTPADRHTFSGAGAESIAGRSRKHSCHLVCTPPRMSTLVKCVNLLVQLEGGIVCDSGRNRGGVWSFIVCRSSALRRCPRLGWKQLQIPCTVVAPRPRGRVVDTLHARQHAVSRGLRGPSTVLGEQHSSPS